MITAQGTGAGSNQISDACESGKSQGMSAGSKTQAREFSQPACNKSGFGVISHVHAIINTRTNCNNVIERSAKFNANNIICCVDTISGGRKQCTCVNYYLLIVGYYNFLSSLTLCYITSLVEAT